MSTTLYGILWFNPSPRSPVIIFYKYILNLLGIDMYKKNCPRCGKEQVYTLKSNMLSAKKVGRVCRDCFRRDQSEKYKGSNNPFFGKTHSNETKNKIRNAHEKNIASYKSDEFKKKMSSVTKGANNPMYGKTFYDTWVEKYGVDEADKRLEQRKISLSSAMSGKNNPMYGKPTPQGSGNGWSGWYKGWFFRSLMELSYVIKELENKGIPWCSAEKRELTIPYEDEDGNPRTYRADFLVGDKLIEVKPKSLHSTKRNLAKKKGALLFCEENGYEYEMVSCEKLPDKELMVMIEAGSVSLTERYQEKYNNWKRGKSF
jgi:hypothetical protein